MFWQAFWVSAAIVGVALVVIGILAHWAMDKPYLAEVVKIRRGQYHVKLRSKMFGFWTVETHWFCRQNSRTGKMIWRHPRTLHEAPKVLSAYLTQELNKYLAQKPW